MIRALSVAVLLLAAAVFAPMLISSSAEAAPPISMPGVPGAPGEHLPECPWHATIEIIDCVTGEVIGWRTTVVSSQSQCSAGIQSLIQSATQTHHECVGNSWCTEYRWCVD
jgi:hypothetical protein